MTRKVVVIGAGPAGYVCAIRLKQLGQDVTVVEKEFLGGTCLNVGCIPSKAMIAAGALMSKITKGSQMGITVKGVDIDLQKLVEWKASIVKKLTGGIGTLFKQHGIPWVEGSATIKDKNTVVVKNKDGEQTLTCDDIVIATGSTPSSIPGFDIDEEHVWSSTGALAPKKLPKHLLVIGAGVIGLELGMMYRSLGSEVTVVEFTPGALPGTDPDCVKVIERTMKKSKTKLLVNHAATSYAKTADGYRVTVKGPKGESTIDCDQILCAVGRRPFADGLGLENVGLKTVKPGFLEVDKQMRTAVPNIYAVGDMVGQPMLAHKGSHEGLVAAAVIAGKPEENDARCIPSVIYTHPEVAAVGLGEEAAKAAGHEITVGKFPFAASGRAMTLIDTDGFIKIIADAKTDEVLGVHMVGPEVTELVAEAGLAIEMGATTEDIARTVHAHPSLTESMMEAAESVHKMAIHIYQK
ncbi:MAG: dihydrolipoamide dehydrogenase [Planctomycetota bacterium]|jgi:dihydrolipoamide dehydrogenase